MLSTESVVGHCPGQRVWLRFFVAFGVRRGRDCTRSQKRAGKRKGLQRYPGKVQLQAPSTTRSYPHGVSKSTKNAPLGQPQCTLSGARGPSPSHRGGLPACVVFSLLPTPPPV